MEILKKDFYERDTKKVAKELLGKILIRRLNNKFLSGKIVETEAYYGCEDPASRVSFGSPKFCVELMQGEVGKVLIFCVHNNWLLNIIAHKKNKVGAILIRAIKPMNGIEIMQKNRKVKNLKNLTNGPGRLTKALAIDKSLNGIDITNFNSKISISYNKENFEICEDKRIGVSKDLEIPLRFFIKGCKFVSK